MPVDFQSSLASLLRSFAMVASAVQLAKRALVSLLLTLAQQYSVQIQLKREDDDNLETAFRKVVKKTHPDKGEKLADQQSLQTTCERWRALKPDTSSSNLCGEGLCRKQLQRSIDRASFTCMRTSMAPYA